MSAKTIRVIALFQAKPGKVDELKALLTKFIEPTCKEEGCITYELHQNPADLNDLAFIEEWQSNETLDAHLKSKHIVEAIPLVGELVTKSPDIRRYLKCD